MRLLIGSQGKRWIKEKLVDEEYDHGPVLDQIGVPVEPGDSVETLSARVPQQEHRLYVRTLQRIATGEIELQGL